MGRKSLAELEDELAQERDDNARLYTKVDNLRAENRLSSQSLCLASKTNAQKLRATD